MPLPMTGDQFLRATQDQYVQVRSEDGVLIGCMPNFSSDIEVVHTSDGKLVNVGLCAVRAVVIPLNAGIDPRTIDGFMAIPGLPPGPLAVSQPAYGAPPARLRSQRPAARKR